jgi:hypothetical protein
LEFFKEGKIAFGPFQIQISLKIWIKSETVLFFGPGPLVSLAPHLLAPGPCIRVTTSLQAMVHPSVARPHIGPPVSSLQVVAVVPLASLHPCSAAQLPALKSSPPHMSCMPYHQTIPPPPLISLSFFLQDESTAPPSLSCVSVRRRHAAPSRPSSDHHAQRLRADHPSPPSAHLHHRELSSCADFAFSHRRFPAPPPPCSG